MTNAKGDSRRDRVTVVVIALAIIGIIVLTLDLWAPQRSEYHPAVTPQPS